MRRLPLELIERLRALRPTADTPKDHVGFVATSAGVYFLIMAAIEVWRFLAADIIKPLWLMLRPWLFVIALALFLDVGLVEGAVEAICSDASVLFCDNFEDRPATSGWAAVNVGSKTPPWDMNDTTSIIVSTAQARDGTKSLAFNYPACQWNDNQSDTWGCGVGYGTQTFATQTDLWVRMYVFYPTGFLQIAAEKMWSVQTTPSGKRAPWAYNGSPGGGPDLAGIQAGVLMYEHESPTYARYDPNVAPTITFAKNQWYCLELHLVRGTTGRNDGWIDSVQKFDYTANWDESWNLLMISGYNNTLFETQSSCEGKGFRWDGTHCNRDTPQSRYFDNLVVSTARVGCLGAPAGPHGFILRASLPILLGLGAVMAYAMTRQSV